MSLAPPTTQRDVARVCGVHPSTICLALKNSPSIPLPTRLRVQAVAEELGYRPNVAARNLALLRGDKQAVGCLPIAWINQEPQRNHWRIDPEARSLLENARRRVGELGYHLEEIWAREPGMSPTRLAQIVRARGIEGVLFPVHRSFEFSLLTPDWSECALVGINDHRLSEWVDVVCPDHYRNAETIFRQMRRLGCGRVGLAVGAQLDAASNGLVHSCYLRYHAEVSSTDRVPACFLPDDAAQKSAAFEEWLQVYQPDVVVCAEAGLVASARAAGFNALWIGLNAASSPFDGGIDESACDVAGAAVDCVVDKMRRFEKGVREATRVHLLKSAWIEPTEAQLEPETVVA
jgi:DNA-binding LacI/PurR family transcriptional regulator